MSVNSDIESETDELGANVAKQHKPKSETKTESKPKSKTNDGLGEIDKMRVELISASRDGHIEKSTAVIERMTTSAVKKIHKEWTIERTGRANEFLTDLFISKFVDCVGCLTAIENVDEMEKELKQDQLLRTDLTAAVSWISPDIPFVGLHLLLYANFFHTC